MERTCYSNLDLTGRCVRSGAPGRSRTDDRPLTRRLLWPLSYRGKIKLFLDTVIPRVCDEQNKEKRQKCLLTLHSSVTLPIFASGGEVE